MKPKIKLRVVRAPNGWRGGIEIENQETMYSNYHYSEKERSKRELAEKDAIKLLEAYNRNPNKFI